MCKRNFPDKNKASKGCVRKTPQKKREKRRSETPHRKIKQAWDV